LKNTDWIIVKDLVELLEKFAKVSEIISGEYYPTLSILFPCVEILKTHLKNYIPKSQKLLSIPRIIKKELTSRYNYKSENMEPALKATILDPRFKNLEFFFSKSKVKRKAGTLLREEFDRLRNDVHPECSTTSKNKKRKLSFSDLFSNETNQDELTTYRSMQQIKFDDDPLEWWRKNQSSYRILSILARKYLSIPATSTPAERLFSTAGNVISRQRSSLNLDTASMLIVLHENYKMNHKTEKITEEITEEIADEITR
jgi:hypothetical protein